MNKLTLLTIVTLSLILFSCVEEKKERAQSKPKVQVKTAGISIGYLPDNIELTGKTIYLNKSSLVAPIGGYITKVNVKQGDQVSEGDLLFEIQTPESFVMQKKENPANNYGLINIYAPVSGRVVSLNIVNTGVFTDKGSEMCLLLSSDDLKLQVSVPFEYNKLAKTGNNCTVNFPDNSSIAATFTNILPQIDETSQTVKVLASLNTSKFIPENMIVQVLIDKSKKHEAQILPKHCLQTDALMSKFWVMKLINDSTAVQTAVEIGNQTHDQVEIISPQFNASDLFISEGAYGLSGTVLVETIK